MAIASTLSVVATAALASSAGAARLRVTIDNLAPENGTFLTPVWVGFHNGTFDIYDRDVSLDLFPGTEALVEDGITAPLSARFADEAPTGVDGTIFGPNGPLGVGESTSFTFDVDASNQYFSYASMVIPSNDAFVANGNPLAFEIFDDAGKFLGADFTVTGSQVLDGGTEINDEAEFSTAFLGQQTPDTGVDENGVVTEHPGFEPGGRILSAVDFGPNSLTFTGADFTQPGYQIARIRVEKVPEPATVLGLLALSGGMVAAGRTRKAHS